MRYFPQTDTSQIEDYIIFISESINRAAEISFRKINVMKNQARWWNEMKFKVQLKTKKSS